MIDLRHSMMPSCNRGALHTLSTGCISLFPGVVYIHLLGSLLMMLGRGASVRLVCISMLCPAKRDPACDPVPVISKSLSPYRLSGEHSVLAAAAVPVAKSAQFGGRPVIRRPIIK